MKGIKIVIIPIILLLGLTNCREEKDPVLEYAEQVLPGLWKIDSVSISRNPNGVSYHGNTFYIDTTFYNIGTFEIDPFSSDSLRWYNKVLECELTIEGESFPIGVDAMFRSINDLFTIFHYNGPDGVQPIDTPAKEFFWTANIFIGNYVMYINDPDHLMAVRSNDENDVVFLSRM